MAEFQEVMRQRKRMCDSIRKCSECKLDGICGGYPIGKLEIAERIIMDWAAAHPEPRYPTWEEWQKATFPEARNQICINHFAPPTNCRLGCKLCRREPIPADIAQKLGIQPIKIEPERT